MPTNHTNSETDPVGQGGCGDRKKRPARVAFLGPEFTYSHLAAIKWFGEAAQWRPASTIDGVFDAVVRGQADFGVAPLATVADGELVETVARLADARVRRCGELSLGVHHHLLGKCPLGEVREVYSRRQALSQCRQWLDANLPAARRIETPSTAEAARLVQTRRCAAAIASRQAGHAYRLEVLALGIEDRADNSTQFVVFKMSSLLPPAGNSDR